MFCDVAEEINPIPETTEQQIMMNISNKLL
jgi:hypothetical protein